ncbi:hypothetical protein HK101_010367 [Irineochytrium annulatum]|nr:hypothetical protein HK101_010367 [Irineochytrium annulatum]
MYRTKARKLEEELLTQRKLLVNQTAVLEREVKVRTFFIYRGPDGPLRLQKAQLAQKQAEEAVLEKQDMALDREKELRQELEKERMWRNEMEKSAYPSTRWSPFPPSSGRNTPYDPNEPDAEAVRTQPLLKPTPTNLKPGFYDNYPDADDDAKLASNPDSPISLLTQSFNRHSPTFPARKITTANPAHLHNLPHAAYAVPKAAEEPYARPDYPHPHTPHHHHHQLAPSPAPPTPQAAYAYAYPFQNCPNPASAVPGAQTPFFRPRPPALQRYIPQPGSASATPIGGHPKSQYLVNAEKIGLIIGKRGQVIRLIREVSGARVHISEKTIGIEGAAAGGAGSGAGCQVGSGTAIGSSCGQRVVTISGRTGEVAVALRMLEDKLA